MTQVGERINPKVLVISQENPQYRCDFCHRSTVDSLTWGHLYHLKEEGTAPITLHYFCLIFSAGLSQNGTDEEGILGFLPKDIHKELRRGSKLRCKYCRLSNATIGCWLKTCNTSFHYPCGFENGNLFQFIGNYEAYCANHRRDSPINVPRDLWECPICFMGFENEKNPIKPPCCKNNSAVIHRKCMMELAQTSGLHFFKCPLCNDKELFSSSIRASGVYVPDRDAAWELEPNAFSELNQQYNRCDARPCMCPAGREYNSQNINDTKWKLARCGGCGASAQHQRCGGLSNLSYRCENCVPILTSPGQGSQVSSTSTSSYEGRIRRRVYDSDSSEPEETRASNLRNQLRTARMSINPSVVGGSRSKISDFQEDNESEESEESEVDDEEEELRLIESNSSSQKETNLQKPSSEVLPPITQLQHVPSNSNQFNFLNQNANTTNGNSSTGSNVPPRNERSVESIADHLCSLIKQRFGQSGNLMENLNQIKSSHQTQQSSVLNDLRSISKMPESLGSKKSFPTHSNDTASMGLSTPASSIPLQPVYPFSLGLETHNQRMEERQPDFSQWASLFGSNQQSYATGFESQGNNFSSQNITPTPTNSNSSGYSQTNPNVLPTYGGYTLPHSSSSTTISHSARCGICNEVIYCISNPQKQLEIHIQTFHSSGIRISCPYCSQPFMDEASLKSHLATSFEKIPMSQDGNTYRFDVKRPYGCFYCESSFPAGDCLYFHTRTHEGWVTQKGQFRCTFCSNVFKDVKFLSNHLDQSCEFVPRASSSSLHQQTNNCEEAHGSTSTANSLQQIQNESNEDLLHQSMRPPKRGIVSPSEQPKRKYVKRSSKDGDSPNKRKGSSSANSSSSETFDDIELPASSRCPKCYKYYSYPLRLKRHIQQCTVDDSGKELRCPYCPAFYYEKLQLLMHISSAHSDTGSAAVSSSSSSN